MAGSWKSPSYIHYKTRNLKNGLKNYYFPFIYFEGIIRIFKGASSRIFKALLRRLIAGEIILKFKWILVNIFVTLLSGALATTSVVIFVLIKFS